MSIPEKFWKFDKEKPSAYTVGELIELLKELPGDMEIENGFSRGTQLTVYNFGKWDEHLGFDEIDDL